MKQIYKTICVMILVPFFLLSLYGCVEKGGGNTQNTNSSYEATADAGGYLLQLQFLTNNIKSK